jgi:hypothetical protein
MDGHPANKNVYFISSTPDNRASTQDFSFLPHKKKFRRLAAAKFKSNADKVNGIAQVNVKPYFPRR